MPSFGLTSPVIKPMMVFDDASDVKAAKLNGDVAYVVQKSLLVEEIATQWRRNGFPGIVTRPPFFWGGKSIV